MKGVLDLQIFLKEVAYQKKNPQLTTQEKNKYSTDNSDDGGDHNPPKGSLERPHKLPVTSKRKRKTNQQGVNEVHLKMKFLLKTWTWM
jgi:hypothetical protein